MPRPNQHMPSGIIEDRRLVLATGKAVAIRIWRDPAHPEALRYALTYGTPDESAVSYADSDGSGGVRRIREREVPYPFVSVARLVADFERNVRREIEHERSDPARG